MFEPAETVLASGGSVLIEGNLQPDLAGPALAAIEARTGCRLMQVFVDAESETLVERLVSRQGSQHRHFGDRMFHGEGVHVGTQLTEPYPRLDITDTIEVDTTDLDSLDYTPVVEAVRARLAVP
jgi:hypothetical protein